MTEQDPSRTPFEDLDDYVSLPRVGGLALSPDGNRLVTAVAERSADGKRYSSALWEVDPEGRRPARRLTRSTPGEAQPAFLPDGRLLFSSRRPDVAAKPDDDTEDRTALWLLPEAGEARLLARRGGDVADLAVARDSGEVVFVAALLPGTDGVEEDERRRKARKEAGVTAILHETHPVRDWDHDVGPDEWHVLAGGRVPPGDGRLATVRDLRPAPEGRVLEGLAVSPDGGTVAVGWKVDDAPAASRPSIALLSAAGELRLVEEADRAFGDPAFSPDGRSLACVREDIGDWETSPRCTLVLVDLSTGEHRDLLPGSSLWPAAPVFDTAGDTLYFVADDHGRAPVCKLDLATGTVTRLTGEGAYTDLVVSPDDRSVYALRSAVDAPPGPDRPRAGRAGAGAAARPGAGRAAARPAHRGHHHRGRRHPAARLARAAGDRGARTGPRRCCCGSTAAR